MKVEELLKKNAKKIQLRKNTIFSFDLKKQEQYINSFSEPKDDIERGYFQYKCQMKLLGMPFTIILNIGSMLLLCVLWGLRSNSKGCLEKREKQKAVFVSQGLSENVIPDSLKKKYKSIYVINGTNTWRWSDEDKHFMRSIMRRYPISFHFLLKVFLKVNMYSAWKFMYDPEAIIVCSEYSFTSSVLSAYCQRMKIEHINVMHGEKLYYMRDTFFRFDKCYIWDEFYKSLFEMLRADKEQFIIELPNSMKFETKVIEKKYDYVFYLTQERGEEINTIAKNLEILKKQGNRVGVRPHPRYTNMEEAKKAFSNIDIEDTREVEIEKSILRTENVISLYSTVLNQAIHNNISIVVDDVTNREKYLRLKEMGFICLSKKHKLLSDLMWGDKNEARKKC